MNRVEEAAGGMGPKKEVKFLSNRDFLKGTTDDQLSAMADTIEEMSIFFDNKMEKVLQQDGYHGEVREIKKRFDALFTSLLDLIMSVAMRADPEFDDD